MRVLTRAWIVEPARIKTRITETPKASTTLPITRAMTTKAMVAPHSPDPAVLIPVCPQDFHGKGFDKRNYGCIKQGVKDGYA